MRRTAAPARRRRRRRSGRVHRAAARSLEKNVNELKEQIFRTKARLNLLKETVLGGVIGASRAIIHHKNEMGSSFRLIKAAYALDGVQIYCQSRRQRALWPRCSEFDVYNGAIQPGLAHAVGRADLPGQRLRRVQLPQGLQVQRQVEPHLRGRRLEDHQHHRGRLREGQHHDPALRQAGGRLPRQRHVGRRGRGDGSGGAGEEIVTARVMKQRDAHIAVTPFAARARHRWGLTAALGSLAGTIGRAAARADEVDDAVKKLIDLDQRVHLMSLEFKEAPPPPPDAADRRVLDAQVLLQPEELRRGGDDPARRRREVPEHARLRRRALPARRVAVPGRATTTRPATTSQEAVAKNNGVEAGAAGAAAAGRDLAAHRRLRATSTTTSRGCRTSRRERWSRRPVRARQVLYFRGRLDDAPAVFASIPPTNPYYFQARYFLATIQVKKGDLAGASTDLRRAAQAAGARRRRQGHSGSGAAGDRAHPLRAVAVRQGDRGVPVGPAPVDATGRRRCASRPGRTSRPRTGSGPTAR